MSINPKASKTGNLFRCGISITNVVLLKCGGFVWGVAQLTQLENTNKMKKELECSVVLVIRAVKSRK